MATATAIPSRWEDSITIWKLAGPAVALNSLQTINSLLDNSFVQQLQPAALTAVGASTNVVFLFISMSMALGTAATAVVSRAYGARQGAALREGSSKCLGFSILTGILFALLAVPGSWLASLVFVPAADKLAQHLLIAYICAFACSLPAVFAINSIAGSLRGVGDTISPMVISGVQIALHITFNYLFIFPTHQMGPYMVPGLGLGLPGAGWALCASSWVAAIGYLFWIVRTPLGKAELALPGWAWVVRITRIAMPAATMNLLRTGSLMLITIILTHVANGSLAIGGMRPGFSLESLAFMPAFGLAMSAAALVGQSLGAEDPRKAERVGWLAAHYGGFVSFVGAAFMFFYSDKLAGWLLKDSLEFAPYTASYLRIIATTETLFGYSMVLTSAMQGAGDTVRPLWITVLSTLLVRVPLAMVLSLGTLMMIGSYRVPGFNLGSDGCWIAMASTQAAMGIGAWIMFAQGKWKKAKV